MQRKYNIFICGCERVDAREIAQTRKNAFLELRDMLRMLRGQTGRRRNGPKNQMYKDLRHILGMQ